jgi:hypothetical protein
LNYVLTLVHFDKPIETKFYRATSHGFSELFNERLCNKVKIKVKKFLLNTNDLNLIFTQFNAFSSTLFPVIGWFL